MSITGHVAKATPRHSSLTMPWPSELSAGLHGTIFGRSLIRPVTGTQITCPPCSPAGARLPLFEPALLRHHSLILFDSEDLTPRPDNSPIDSAPAGDCIILDQWLFHGAMHFIDSFRGFSCMHRQCRSAQPISAGF